MNLVIVESPTKAKTISKFLGSHYQVESSFGHVRDLPKSKLGVEVEKNFEPQYIIPKKNQKQVTALKKVAEKAESVILATDEDREGEAIAWHLLHALKLEESKIDRVKRIVFHEITKTAIDSALKNPREIDLHLVDAQQARRVLDRLVGYKLSPFLWKKIARGLSAGRVQSVALRLIVEREEEIKKFHPEEYWTLTALLETKKNEKLEATLVKINHETIPKLSLKTKDQVEVIKTDLMQSLYEIAAVNQSELRKNPMPPFITSTLQQTASRAFGFSSKKTMYLAQSLYEKGHITYMRTDSVNLAQDALLSAESWVKNHLGSKYSQGPKTYHGKSKLAQEAHEAIRPSNVDFAPLEFGQIKTKKNLEKDEQKLYDLIWRRFIASQLPPAILDATRIEISAQPKNTATCYMLHATGNVMRFDGFLKVWPTKLEEKTLPAVAKGDELNLIEINPLEHFTEPPPRYNEASLIKTLEKFGIGRPSTYAPTISVIQDRNYVEKLARYFHPTEIGTLVNKVLSENFPKIVDIDFTAKMEEELDEIAEGKKNWQTTIKEFYEPFSKNLEQKYEAVSKQEIVDEKTDEVCEKCGKPMIVKFGRFGKFIACSGFPDCKNTKNLKGGDKTIGLKCPKCHEGDVIEKRVNKKGRARGKIFWGCSRYPDCDYASWTNPLEKKEEDEKIKTSAEANLESE
ncbi:MAG: type I DNA topoisomerase [Candidatus Liptonbacteria bacterium]|nr:type I DNA topoisomerase [Candidatus Liptonbacteria bacterium]